MATAQIITRKIMFYLRRLKKIYNFIVICADYRPTVGGQMVNARSVNTR